MTNLEVEQSVLQQNLLNSAKFAKYFSYITFVSIFFSLVQIVLNISSNIYGIGLTVLMLVPIVITSILAICLFFFSKYTNTGLRNNDNAYFRQAFHNLKLYFIVTGVILIIILSLFTLFLLIAILAFAFK